MRASFSSGSGEDKTEEDGDLVDDDEEFESHYSRRESAEEESGSSDEESESVVTGNRRDHADSDFDPVQRVNSLPISRPDYQHILYNRIHGSQSTTALGQAAPSVPLPPLLYPPFYNKPHLPLPPSPSFTSLLRPPSLLNRSTTSTRPTTPDSSDVDTPNETEAAVAQSARRAQPLPPTAPKVPTYEYYGFVLYLGSTLAFLMYLLWSYLPSPFLHALGVTYYPNRWWSLAIPAWIVMLLVYIYVALTCYNVEYLTLPLARIETMVDQAGNVAVLDDAGKIRKGGSKRWMTEMEERRRYEESVKHKERRKKGHRHGRRDKRKDRREEVLYGFNGETDATGIVNGLNWRQVWSEGTDAVMDIPLGGVCEVLYGDG